MGTREEMLDLIDLAFYEQVTGRPWSSSEEALDHQLTIGWKNCHDPNRWFSNHWYLQTYRDVAESGMPPLLHYVEFGHAEGRDPSAQFSTAAHRARSLDGGDGNPLRDFLRSRLQSEKLDQRCQGLLGMAALPLDAVEVGMVREALDAEWYAAVHGLGAPGEACDHYLSIGRSSRCAPTPGFDPVGYVLHNSDVYRNACDPFLHYILHVSSGREYREVPPASDAVERGRLLLTAVGEKAAVQQFAFQKDWYEQRYADMRRPGTNLPLHYVVFGEGEGRSPNMYFDPVFYAKASEAARGPWKGGLLEHFVAVGCWLGLAPSRWVEMAMARGGHANAIEWLMHYLGMPDEIVRPGNPVRVRRPAKQATQGPVLDPVLVNAYRENAPGDYARVINWVIPSFSKGGGGHTNLFRCSRTLSRLGYRQVMWLYDQVDTTAALAARETYINHFPSTIVDFRIVNERFFSITGEIVIASTWQSTHFVNSVREGNACLYFVQDAEGLFHAAGETALRADWTYNLGLDCICGGDWLLHTVARKAPRAIAFQYAADNAFKASGRKLADRPVDLCLYLRGHTERRCSRMLAETVQELAARANVRICVFGDDQHNADLPPSVFQLGIISSAEMARLFGRTKLGLVASATNYSIVPVEMAAAGMLVLEPASNSTLATTQLHGVRSVPPDPVIMAETIEKTLSQLTEASFEEATRKSRTWGQSLDWESEFENVARFLGKYHAPAERNPTPMRRESRNATIVIPTYYPGPSLVNLLAAIERQRTSLDRVDVLVVDSVKEGKADPVMAKIPWNARVRRHELDAVDFQHGGTRNRAAMMTDTECVVFITQDAMPYDDYWLESLVTPLWMYSNAALAYGRHVAYKNHHPLYGVELKSHFDSILERGSFFQLHGNDKRYATDPYYRAAMCFNSDNNAAYRGDVLRRIGFPSVDFGEDQAFALASVEAGYATVFASSATVYHSHDYTSDHAGAAARGFQEARGYDRIFGIRRFADENEQLTAQASIAEWAFKQGIGEGLSMESIQRFIAAKHRYIEGMWAYCRSVAASKEQSSQGS